MNFREFPVPTSSPRLCIAVLFGGRSAEHDVSVLSATNVFAALDPALYNVVAIYVTRDGRWLASQVENGTPAQPEIGPELCLLPGGKGWIIEISPDTTTLKELPPIDILFLVLHGLSGEDGSVQGMVDVAGVPLAGCGILGSATALDKIIAKRLFDVAGLPTAHSLTAHKGAVPTFAEVRETLGLSVFVKPARQGSSVGVSKAET